MSVECLYMLISNSDREILSWLYNYYDSKEITASMLLELNNNVKIIEKSLKDLEKEDFLRIKWSDDVIIEIELTTKAKTYLRGRSNGIF